MEMGTEGMKFQVKFHQKIIEANLFFSAFSLLELGVLYI
jgi:hypothetical protein